MATEASELYEHLKGIYRQLEQLSDADRIRLTPDKYNTYPSPNLAVMDALAGIEQAINATCWMETLPESEH